MKQCFTILLRLLGPFLRISFLPLKPADSKLYFKETVESTFYPVKSLLLYLTNKQVTYRSVYSSTNIFYNLFLIYIIKQKVNKSDFYSMKLPLT